MSYFDWAKFLHKLKKGENQAKLFERENQVKCNFLIENSHRKTVLPKAPYQACYAAIQLEMLSVLEKPLKISAVLKYHDVYLFVVTIKQLLPRFCGDQT